MDNMLEISEVAKKIGIENNIEPYGKYKAKISDYNVKSNKHGKLILVTSINPTPSGEGKTTLSIGLNDSMRKLGYNSIVVLREPSLGPVFGSKGGATGGGNAIVLPQEDINLHFNGDFHAITSANNLLAAIIDDHIFKGNELKLKEVTFRRCLDVNDRELRNVKLSGREESFVITPASEIMAIICLAKDFDDLKSKIDHIVIGYDENNKEVFAKDLKATNAIAALLKDAIKPNLVQTKYHNPAIIHGGPFANIAHGCNSIIATKFALSISDYVITEAGFGSDMGGLKFIDIKSRLNDIYPDLIIVNATIKALKYHGDDDIKKGFANLKYHIDLMKNFSSNVIVSLNKFTSDTQDEINTLKELVLNEGVEFTVSDVYAQGEDGATELAKMVVDTKENTKKGSFSYELGDDIEVKINKLCKTLGAANVVYGNDKVKENIDRIRNSEFNKYPICIAKTPMSITDNKDVLGAPKDFTYTITDIKVSGGSGFIVVCMGNTLLMPGFGKTPNYLKF